MAINSDPERPYTVTQQQVSKDLQAIRTEWQHATLNDFGEKQAEELAKLNELNQTPEDWPTRHVTLSAGKGLGVRCFAPLSMTGGAATESKVSESHVFRFRAHLLGSVGAKPSACRGNLNLSKQGRDTQDQVLHQQADIGVAARSVAQQLGLNFSAKARRPQPWLSAYWRHASHFLTGISRHSFM